MAAPILELEGAGIRYGALRALAGVDLGVSAGERVALIGPSGAGKSSLIALLNGTAAPSEGRVRVLGRDLERASARELRDVQRRLGTVHQQFDLVAQLRVIHNVNAGRLGSWSFWRALLSLAAPREAREARRALRRVGLEEKLFERAGSLSGGEQQRVAIARVLVQHPHAILADEPIASLDPARGAEIMELLHEVCAETGTALLASLHDVEVALRGRFDRVVGLREGRVAFDCAPGELSERAVGELYATEREARAG